MRAQHYIDQRTVAIDGAMQIPQFATDFDVGLLLSAAPARPKRNGMSGVTKMSAAPGQASNQIREALCMVSHETMRLGNTTAMNQRAPAPCLPGSCSQGGLRE